MFCGYLTTYGSGFDVFRDRNNRAYKGVKILQYKHLKLVRA